MTSPVPPWRLPAPNGIDGTAPNEAGTVRHGPGLRGVLVRVHRYLGLTLAGFLILLGITGSLLVYERELDAWINPALWRATPGRALSPQAIADRVTAQDPRVEARWVPLGTVTAADVWVDWKPDAQGIAAVRGYDQVFVDPVSGAINGRRRYTSPGLERATILPFVHALHSSLLLPGRAGPILLGIVALLWLVMSLIGFTLTLPRGRRFWAHWRKAWAIKRHVRRERRHYDLHRAGGLWAWGLMILTAVSGVALTLPTELFEPVVTRFSPIAAPPWEGRTAAPMSAPSISFDRALASASRAARAAGVRAPSSGLFLGPEIGMYGVAFGQQEEAGIGQAWVHVDRTNGRVISVQPSTGGTAGDIVERIQLSVHAGRVGGAGTRVLAVLVGLATAMLSVTGVLVWWHKRRARIMAAGMHQPRSRKAATAA